MSVSFFVWPGGTIPRQSDKPTNIYTSETRNIFYRLLSSRGFCLSNKNIKMLLCMQICLDFGETLTALPYFFSLLKNHQPRSRLRRTFDFKILYTHKNIQNQSVSRINGRIVLSNLDWPILVDDFSALKKKIIQKFWDGGSIYQNLNGGINLVYPPEFFFENVTSFTHICFSFLSFSGVFFQKLNFRDGWTNFK